MSAQTKGYMAAFDELPASIREIINNNINGFLADEIVMVSNRYRLYGEAATIAWLETFCRPAP